MNKFYTDKETEMPDQLFDDIDKYEIGERQEIWMDDLFTRRKFYQEKKLREMEDSDFWKFMWNLSKNKGLSYMKDGNGYLVTNREELALVSKNEAIEEYLEGLDGSEDEHTDFIVNVFMRD